MCDDIIVSSAIFLTNCDRKSSYFKPNNQINAEVNEGAMLFIEVFQIKMTLKVKQKTSVS